MADSSSRSKFKVFSQTSPESPLLKLCQAASQNEKESKYSRKNSQWQKGISNYLSWSLLTAVFCIMMHFFNVLYYGYILPSFLECVLTVC